MTELTLTLMALCLLTVAVAHADIPRPEHPRPDFERADWLNLNGEWQWEVDEEGDGESRGLMDGQGLARTITVPFCPESELSGIGNRDYMVHTWYRRAFSLPKSMQGKRLLLHFGAVDWHARVWVNGEFAGEHRGGFSPFALEVTDFVTDGENWVVVHCYDKTDTGLQGAGKQSFGESHGCVYTRTTGIWQTVWLEAVGSTYLRDLSVVPDVDGGRIICQGWVDGPNDGVKLRLNAMLDGRPVGKETVDAAWRQTYAVLKLKETKLWHPGDPNLYDLTVELVKDGEVIDSVRSYFGMRKITIEGNRFLINDKPVFQRLILDQGFYPDGIYTAPTDEALKHDIELSMAAGFNGARLHQKVFEPRLLYWADKLGYIVWGEYPSWGLSLGDVKAMGDALNEWREIIVRDRNHPSVVGWCPLNETAGGDDPAAAQNLFSLTQVMDPTRPWLDTSGYVHLYRGTDIYDCHDYNQSPAGFEARYQMFSLTGQAPWNNNLSDPRSAYRGQPYFVSEYGGMRLKTGEAPAEGGWGYGETDLQEFLDRYKGLTDAMLDNPNMFAFCYTQLTDIEQEQNGVYFYDRTEKYDPALLKAINEREAAYEKMGPRVVDLVFDDIVPTSERERQEWRYRFDAPGDGWEAADYDDSGWQAGPGGFGTESTPGAVVGTEWDGDDIWLRRKARIDKLGKGEYFLAIHHDEDAEVYINGKPVAETTGYTTGYTMLLRTDALRDALKTGTNVIAVHCRQTQGGQFIDVGIRTARER